MYNTLQIIKTEFAENATIVSKVGTKCSFAVELQDTAPPFIVYNIKEDAPTSKDGSKTLIWTLAVVAAKPLELLQIYDAARSVIDNEVQSITTYFEESSYPDITKDDHFIMEFTLRIETN